MKSELKAKFLQHIIGKKKENEGFTLIELLVVIIIIGILSAIALPSFLNQANKGKQSEAKQYSGSMNRSQQAFFLENGEFTSELNKLGMGIRSQTENYIYEISGNSTGVANNGRSLKAPLKSYVGVVALSTQGGTSEATTLAVLCESDAVGSQATALAPAFDGTQPSCPANFAQLKSK
ncbi:pesticin [Nostoc linckia z18]|uniref:Pesticin n=2 Tax=Nostoc linckia TaxID=92942 RepID=A0A9Q5Z9D4_NOSLI|nr:MULTISPECIES: type IV pilin-like G/H family protein [Nostoc]PHK39945.1 pesticin [Nostoc linckia z15]PHK47621.1 pesticin [Nostoc linckia z16]MBC1237021.1 type IV pilin-like G/H family protein [Nostoc sp. 2RC]PHJ56816.1 pesticin [Nostoc linckia z1]PHJ62707.1 pesticin [Nostoc linckia z2]